MNLPSIHYIKYLILIPTYANYFYVSSFLGHYRIFYIFFPHPLNLFCFLLISPLTFYLYISSFSSSNRTPDTGPGSLERHVHSHGNKLIRLPQTGHVAWRLLLQLALSRQTLQLKVHILFTASNRQVKDVAKVIYLHSLIWTSLLSTSLSKLPLPAVSLRGCETIWLLFFLNAITPTNKHTRCSHKY